MEMEMFKAFIFALLVFTPVLVHAQDQLGFISLDCGLPRNESYSEPSTTGINYISDAPFIKAGVSNSIATQYKGKFQQQLSYLRSFPEGIRNCYKINVTRETKYLIRATFLHGNYDGQNTVPQFDLHLGANYWDTVGFYDVSHHTEKEIIHVSLQDHVRICLVNTGSGTPFISALELRPLENDIYRIPTGSLKLSQRLDMGSSDKTYRYPDDVYDRIWWNNNSKYTRKLNTSLTVDTGKSKYQPPSPVMMTAAAPLDGRSRIDIFWDTSDPDQWGIVGDEFFVYMHFFELQELKANQSRAFNITLNGKMWYDHPFVPSSSKVDTLSSVASTVSTEQGKYNFSLIQLENSTLPPIINALEIYSLANFSQWETDQNDGSLTRTLNDNLYWLQNIVHDYITVDAITDIKSNYGVKRNWDGDPCVPVSYMWEGLNCSNNGFDLPRIMTLNLSSSGLAGEITSDISKLTMIESLDLSNNNFTGSVPDFLSQLPKLRILNLERNNLGGPVPVELVERSKKGALSLSVEGNPNLCLSLPCKKKQHNSLSIPILASICGSVILFIAVAIFVGLIIRRKKPVFANAEFHNFQKDPFVSKKRQFTYSEIRKITNDFEKVLGKGGCGKVYEGSIDDGTKVAVKIISIPPIKGNRQPQEDEKSEEEEEAEQLYQQFLSEVKLLLTVYHGNLTSLVGYCNEGSNMALIYECMENGDLESHLSGKKGKILSWEERLQIAKDAAQGLEYLHDGCKPPIIHRDVKTANILLTKNLRAKLADFGLSRFYATEGATHVSTQFIAGTRGYLDPEVINNGGWLNEKSDVYSFGVVLLQIITGQPAIIGTQNIKDWVRSMLANGDITSIVDPRLQGDFDVNSIWNAVDTARACVSQTSAERPDMSQVVMELKNCLAEELARKNYTRTTDRSTDQNSEVFFGTATTEASSLTSYHSAC